MLFNFFLTWTKINKYVWSLHLELFRHSEEVVFRKKKYVVCNSHMISITCYDKYYKLFDTYFLRMRYKISLVLAI